MKKFCWGRTKSQHFFRYKNTARFVIVCLVIYTLIYYQIVYLSVFIDGTCEIVRNSLLLNITRNITSVITILNTLDASQSFVTLWHRQFRNMTFNHKWNWSKYAGQTNANIIQLHFIKIIPYSCVVYTHTHRSFWVLGSLSPFEMNIRFNIKMKSSKWFWTERVAWKIRPPYLLIWRIKATAYQFAFTYSIKMKNDRILFGSLSLSLLLFVSVFVFCFFSFHTIASRNTI